MQLGFRNLFFLLTMSSSESISPLSKIQERGCIPLDQIQEFTTLTIPSPSPSEGDLPEEVEQRHKETERKRQILAFIIVCVLIVGGIIIEKIKF
jgi:hypothetical protein